MLKKDMRVGMHVGIGSYIQHRRRALTEAYILALPEGRADQYSATKGRAAVAVRYGAGLAWQPQWARSTHIQVADWDAYVALVAAGKLARAEHHEKRRAQEQIVAAEEQRLGALLRALGLTPVAVRDYHDGGVQLSLVDMAALLNLLPVPTNTETV